MDPLVSILIPAYNAEAWIADTIASAVGQTWPRKEIIIIDDGSTDRTLSIAQGFASESVSVVSQENRGGCAARNKAFDLCRGDFIQWLDADDILASDKIEAQFKNSGIQSASKGLSSSAWGRFYYRVEKAKFCPDALWQDHSSREWLLTAFKGNCWMQPASWLVSRELAERAGPWNERLKINQDGEYFLRVVAAGDRVQFVPEARCFYRRANLNCVSAKRSEATVQSFVESLRLSMDSLLAIDKSEEAKEACVQFLQRHVDLVLFQEPETLALLEGMATELGGSLHPPRETRKFTLVRRVLGRRLAKWVKRQEGRLDWAVRAHWDELLSRLSGVSGKQV